MSEAVERSLLLRRPYPWDARARHGRVELSSEEKGRRDKCGAVVARGVSDERDQAAALSLKHVEARLGKGLSRRLGRGRGSELGAEGSAGSGCCPAGFRRRQSQGQAPARRPRLPARALRRRDEALSLSCSGRHAGDRLARRYVPRDDRARTDERAGSDADSTKHDNARSERGATLDDRAHELPVRISLELARLGRRARELVVDEERAVAYEDLVLNLDTAADKAVTLDFAARAYNSVTLDLDERAHTRVVADAASIKVRERRDGDVLAEVDLIDEAVGSVVRRVRRHEPYTK
jgi:hypothetical protein